MSICEVLRDGDTFAVILDKQDFVHLLSLIGKQHHMCVALPKLFRNMGMVATDEERKKAPKMRLQDSHGTVVPAWKLVDDDK